MKHLFLLLVLCPFVMGQSVNVSKEGAYAKLSVTSISQTPSQAALNQFAISLSYVVKSGPVGSSASASAAIPGFVGANTTTHNQSKSGSLSTVLSSLPQKPDGSRYFTMRVDASNLTKYADVICGVTKLKVQFNLEGGLNGSIYQIFQGSNQIDSARIAAGDSYLYTYETYDPTPVYVFSQAGENSLQGDGMWYFVPGAVSGSASTSTTPSAASSNPPVVNVPTPNDGAGSISGGDPGDNAVFQTVENPGGAGLTDAAYKQGVNEIVKAIKGSGGSGGGGGDGTDVSGIETRLDGIKSATEATRDTLKRAYGETEGFSKSAEAGAMATAGQAAASAASASGATAVTNAIPAMSISAPGVPSQNTGSLGSIAVLGTVVQMDPFSFLPSLESMLGWVREAILWGMAYIYFRMFQAKVEDYMKTLLVVPQLTTTEEAIQVHVPGVGAIKQAALATVAVTALGAQIALMIGLGNTNLPSMLGSWSWGNITSVGSVVGSAATPISKAWGYVSLMIPVGAMIQFAGAWMATTWSMKGTFVACAFLIKALRF